MISYLNINDCTTPFDSAHLFPNLMPLTLYPTTVQKEQPRVYFLPKDENGWPTAYNFNTEHETPEISSEAIPTESPT